jgi:hypothetical protein
MNTGQMMITLGAMLLLGVVILRVNSSFFNTNDVLLDSKFGVLAVSLATSIIEDATGKAFDEKTDTNSVNNLTALTAAGSLGPDGEVFPNFNDFDDFNGLDRIDSSMISAQYRIQCNVHYINPASPEVVSAGRTWHKKLTVMVTSKSMEDTLRMSTINSYFYFR